MKNVLLAVSALTLAMVGSAYSASSDHDATMYLTDATKVGAFYTDSSMKTLRPMEERKAMFSKMSKEDQKMMTSMCKGLDPSNMTRYAEFCGVIGQ